MVGVSAADTLRDDNWMGLLMALNALISKGLEVNAMCKRISPYHRHWMCSMNERARMQLNSFLLVIKARFSRLSHSYCSTFPFVKEGLTP